MHSKVDARAFYAQRAALYRFVFLSVYRYGAGVRRHLMRHGNISFGERILDAGCGPGNVTRACVDIARRRGIGGVQFYAFDLTPEMFAGFQRWAERQDEYRVDIVEANVLEPDSLPDSWRGFDLIICSGMLEYVPRELLSAALGNLRARLAPSGRLMLYITRRNPLTRLLVGRWWRANLYDKPELETALSAAGFGGIAFSAIPFPYSYLNPAVWCITARPQ